ncbi:phosphatidate cytidylyltransferase [Aerococcus urinaehominis]|uniref:Phosphatidate cytidylyltransferase n=1 Tax=Aerococcus urinaehominis TaxID=128944 RepID=A0A109RGG4_9LACT|nr:phosphatidate cytidylyltransferase [Aerococcus urinaehominis]AMB98828.1 phosphatidate cytidylyltransferase [Aerococcus urinaehominis]SDM48640.1 phosphatidate cytidylyltransferase [Aerococcus urinaehominis]
MQQRVITALVALAIFIPILLLGGWALELLMALIGVVSMFELLKMRKQPLVSFLSLAGLFCMLVILLPSNYLFFMNQEIDKFLVFYAGVVLMLIHMVRRPHQINVEDVAAVSFFAIYLGMGYHYLLMIRDMGLSYLFLGLIIIFANDSFAYLVGRAVGKHKLAPEVSPNKTIEGSIGGIVGAYTLSTIFLLLTPSLNISAGQNIILVLILALAGQMGDLIESTMKRYYQVKDSGHILPGHGGLVDRFDNLLIVMPLFYFVLSYLN